MVKQINQEELQKIVKSVPMLSPSASQLLQITSQADHDLIDVINLVRNDANLTARVLKIVNSAAFGLVSTVTSIDRAISYLGERIIVGIAIGDSAGRLFEKELSGYESAGGDLWKHDLRTAIAAREVVTQSGVDISSELAFTAGLLHDIGKSLISDYLQGSVTDAIEMITTEERALVYAVHLGDNIAMMGGFGTGSDSMRYKLDQQYTDYIKIGPKTLATIMLNVDIEFEKLESSFMS